MYAILADGIASACFENEASGSAGDTMGAGNRSVETLRMGSAIVSCGVDDGIGIGAGTPFRGAGCSRGEAGTPEGASPGADGAVCLDAIFTAASVNE